MAVWAAWWFVGLGDVRALAILLTSVLLVSVVGGVLLRLEAGLSATLTASDPTPHVGDDVVLTAHLRHRFPWSVPVRLVWNVGQEQVREELVVPRGTGGVTERRVVARQRGPLDVRITRVVADGPLGLVRVRWGMRRTRQQLLVLPPVLAELPGIANATGVVGREQARHGAGEPSGSVREYRDGDPMRHVHWKQSARQGSLLVNVPEGDGGADGTLYLDLDVQAYPDRASFELAVAAAATAGLHMLGRRESLRLHLGDAETHKISSSDELLRRLARVQHGGVEPRGGTALGGDVGSGEGLDAVSDAFLSARVGQAVVVTGDKTARLRAILDESGARDGAVYRCGPDSRDARDAARTDRWQVIDVDPALLPAPPDTGDDFRAKVAKRARPQLARPQVVAGAAILSAAWLIALGGLAPVLEPGQWSDRGAILVALLLLVPAALRLAWPRLRMSAASVGIVAALAMLAYWTSQAERLSQWWFEPLAQVESVHRNIQASDPPMVVEGVTHDFVLFVILLAVTVSALLFVALDSFLVAGIVPLAALIVTPVVLVQSLEPPVLLAAGGLLAALIWVGSLRLTWHGLVAAASALALAAGVVNAVPATRDRVWNKQIVRSSLSAQAPDLTVALGQDLRERSNTVVFSYADAHGSGMLFPLATLSDFSEGRWHPQDEPSADDLTVGRSPERVVPERIDGDPYGREYAVSMTIKGLVSEWLPMPQNPYFVTNARERFDPSQWTWMRDSNTARSSETSTRRGDKYTVFTYPTALRMQIDREGTSEPVRMTLQDDGVSLVPAEPTHWYRDGAAIPEDLQPYLQLPEGVPESVVATAQELTASETDPYFAASALEQYFTSGEFAYDESAPYEPGMDSGNPFAVMDALLQTKRGYCVHFASTFAVMARSVGIPSRVTLGYASPGSEARVIDVRGRQLHAWPEVFIEDLGWVAFEPTPGGAGGGAVADDDPEPLPSPSTTMASPTPSPSTVTVDPETGEVLPDTSAEDVDDGDAVWRWLGAIVLLLALAGSPAGLGLYRSRRRAAMILAGKHPAGAAWVELVDTAADLGMDLSGMRAQTAEATRERLAESGLVTSAEAVAGTELILERANAERYGAPVPGAERSGENGAEASDKPGEGSELGVALAVIVADMRANATRGARVKAVLWPRSVMPGRASG
ncbi:MAG: transglutaminaseTgpA domain-containing protein [Ancrocorticia sp.]